MICYFCKHEIDSSFYSLNHYFCQHCKTRPNIYESSTASFAADIYVKIDNSNFCWKFWFNSREATLYKLNEFNLHKAVIHFDKIPDINVDNIIEKTRMYLLFL